MKSRILSALAFGITLLGTQAQSLYLSGGTAGITNASSSIVNGITIRGGFQSADLRARLGTMNTYSDNINSIILFNAWRNSDPWGHQRLFPGYVGDIAFQHETGSLYFSSSPASNAPFPVPMRVNLCIKGQNGTVGIGTAEPLATTKLHVVGKVLIGDAPTKTLSGHTNYDLAVNGKMICRSLFVIAPTFWADNVFAKDYQLSSLTEVENHIRTHGHLKDVPTEKEVMEKGISVADMDAVLLKKVEELTLYMIQMKKENESLKAEVELLKKK